jgi:hypothetical protein
MVQTKTYRVLKLTPESAIREGYDIKAADDAAAMERAQQRQEVAIGFAYCAAISPPRCSMIRLF